jgi:hypothetical protein
MQAQVLSADTQRYARCIEASKRIRWDIDQDVIRGRDFDTSRKFLPDSLALIGGFGFLQPAEQRFVSQIQGRTYANMFGLVERFIGAHILETSREHRLGDQVALEALVRFADEELKHQALFRRLNAMMAAGMPAGYRFVPDADAVAGVVLRRSAWSVLALTCLIELFTQAHYRQSIDPESNLSELWKDVFLFHWREESQHAILDELEWKREDARLDGPARERAVGDLIVLVGAVDGILQAQARADAEYFAAASGRLVDAGEQARIAAAFLNAYRWQYILSGVQVPHFGALLTGMLSAEQHGRIAAALAPLFDSASRPHVRSAA